MVAPSSPAFILGIENNRRVIGVGMCQTIRRGHFLTSMNAESSFNLSEISGEKFKFCSNITKYPKRKTNHYDKNTKNEKKKMSITSPSPDINDQDMSKLSWLSVQTYQ